MTLQVSLTAHLTIVGSDIIALCCTACFVLTSREIPFSHSALGSSRLLQLWSVNDHRYHQRMLRPLPHPFRPLFSQGKGKGVRLLSPTGPDSSVFEFSRGFKILPMIWKSSGNKSVPAEVSICHQT